MDNKTKMVLTEMNVEKQNELGSPCDLEVHINLTSLHLQKFTIFHGFHHFKLPLLNHKQLHNIRIRRGIYNMNPDIKDSGFFFMLIVHALQIPNEGKPSMFLWHRITAHKRYLLE